MSWRLPLKVLFITNLPSPYRVDFFNELGKSVNLTVCYERRSSSERNKEWVNKNKRNYQEIFISAKKVGVDKSIGLGLVRELKRDEYDYLIVTGFSSPSVIILILYCQLHKIPYIMEDDGGLYNINGEKHRWIKYQLLKKVKAYFTTTDENIKALIRLGVNEEIIYKYPFSSVKNIDIEEGIIKRANQDEIKSNLQVDEEKVILAIGQFIQRKGFDILLKAFKNMPSNYGLYFVGGEPTSKYLELVSRLHLNNVHFVGFKSKEDLKNYYSIADVFVLPTREDIWGLVVNEALAAGLPVITTDKCGAGLELIKNGENGYLVKVEDSEEISSRIVEILKNEVDKNIMSENAINVARKYTIEEMAEWHMKMLEKLDNMEMDKRRK